MNRERIIGLILILALTLPIGLTYSYLHIKNKAIRREIKWKIIEGIDRNELEILTFTNEEIDTELKWKHDHEFEYNGQMYDVVERKSEAGKVTFWCWLDHEETRLSKKLKYLLNDALGSDAQRKNRENKLIQFLKDLFYNLIDSNKWQDFGIDLNKFTAFSSSYTSPFLSVGSPPPDKLYT